MAIAESAHIKVFPTAVADPTDHDAPSELLTVQEEAQFLKVSVSWIYEHVRPDTADRLPVLKVGKYLRFDRRDLRAYIDAKRETARAPRRRR
jgi:excisionase family DNA binding protein